MRRILNDTAQKVRGIFGSAAQNQRKGGFQMKTPIGCTTSSFSAAWKFDTMLGMVPHDSFDADYG
jgi:hypothetical protein